MDGSSRHASGPLNDWLATLRRLERACDDSPRIGRSRRPADDAIRLAHPPSLAFAPSAVAEVVADPRGRVTVLGTVLGLWGPNGALPLHLTEYALERRRIHRDTALEAFADVFHHRMLGLFYRAWAEAQPCVQADRPADDAFASYMDSLAGSGADGTAVSRLMRFAAGHFTARTRHAEGLVAVVALLLALPVAVEEWVAGWLVLDDPARARLGRTRLARDGVIGRAVRDAAGRFRLRIGPMGLDRYESLSPGGKDFDVLVSVVHRYTGAGQGWDARLCLATDAVPPPRLAGRVRLGRSTWLGGVARHRADDLVVEPPTYGSHAHTQG